MGSQRTIWRVLRVVTISLWGNPSGKGIWSWLMPLLIPVITILMLLIRVLLLLLLSHFSRVRLCATP